MITTQDFFDKCADSAYKNPLSSYYWNDIIRYCQYFVHEELSVLEIGCGQGDLLAKLKVRKRTGIDSSERMIAAAFKRYPHIDFRVMNAENLCLNEKFDLIILSNLVGYLPDVQKAFRQLHRVCHEKTKIIVTYYNWVWEPILRLAELLGLKSKGPLQNWLTLSDIQNLLYISGFDVYRNNSRMLVPVYVPFVSGFFNRFLSKLPLFEKFALNNFTFAKPRPDAVEAAAGKRYSVSVVIPARNESGNIEAAILRMPKLGCHTEIIFVEGNSTDDTWEKICGLAQKYSEDYDIKIAKQPGKGKNDAVRTGFAMATGDILMILDADLTVPPEDLEKFYDVIASGKADFVNGSRLVYPMEKQAMRFLNLLGNRFFSSAFTFLLDQRLKDTLCGTKVLFRTDYLRLAKNREYFGDFDPFGDYDLLFGAHKLNLQIVEVPIRYRERTYGETNISRFRHGLILLKMCLFASRKIKFI